MGLLLTAVVTGLGIGSVYGLVGIGYTVVYSATGVFNLAQGDLVMCGVMFSWIFLDVLHWPQLAAFAGVLVVVTAISVAEERTVVRPFLKDNAEGIGWFIATLGFSLAVETIATILYGNRPIVAIPGFLPQVGLHAGPVSTTPQLLLSLATLVVIVGAIEVFYARTWMGRAMRATAQDRTAAALRGISPDRVGAFAFALGGLVAGVAGFVVAPIVFSNVTIGLSYSLKGFLALAIGGFGSIRGAVAGALVLGVGEQIFDLYVSPLFEQVAGLGLLLIVLALRPNGIFGRYAARRV
jgi:branched-chain amino acid transport system permease protein